MGGGESKPKVHAPLECVLTCVRACGRKREPSFVLLAMEVEILSLSFYEAGAAYGWSLRCRVAGVRALVQSELCAWWVGARAGDADHDTCR